MAIQSISGMDGMLQQMQALSRVAGGEAAVASAPAASGGFAAELQRSIARISEAQGSADAAARAFEMGEPGVALNDVMINMQKASIGFQAAVQVRNRLVAAYQEIASMPV